MIKEHRCPAARHENRDTVANYESFRVIDLEAIPADKFHHKRSEWLASLKRSQ